MNELTAYLELMILKSISTTTWELDLLFGGSSSYRLRSQAEIEIEYQAFNWIDDLGKYILVAWDAILSHKPVHVKICQNALA